MRVEVRRGSVVLAALLAGACSGTPAAPAPAAPEPAAAASGPAAAAPAPQEKPAPADTPAERREPHKPPQHHLGFSNAGALGLSLLESGGGTSATAPGSPDVLVAWALVAREPNAAKAFKTLRASGQLAFHVDALLCLSALEDRAEFERRLSALIPDAPAWKPVAPREDESLSPTARLAFETLTRVRDYEGDSEIETSALGVLLAEGDVAAFRALVDEPVARARIVGLLGLAVADRDAALAKMREIRDAVGPLPAPGATAKRPWKGEDSPERDDLQLSAAGRLALDVLLKSSCFMSSMVGEGGDTPPPVYALRVLLDEADAEGALRWLAWEEPAVARLYAACGLRALASPAAKDVFDDLKTREDHVGTFSGCERSDAAVAKVAASIESGGEDDIAGR